MLMGIGRDEYEMRETEGWEIVPSLSIFFGLLSLCYLGDLYKDRIRILAGKEKADQKQSHSNAFIS